MRLFNYITPALCASLLLLASCTKDNGTGIPTRPDYAGGVNADGIPTYADDYSSLSSWANHMYWNLANVHDPSIAWYDGYYYMFGTDASYGNEHDKATVGKHFQGKRSKDLVNWTHVYGPMNEAPSWVKDSLNNIRGRMSLAPIDTPNYAYWAPVIRVVDGKLRMYYSIVIDDKINGIQSWSERAFIGMCETTNPSDPDSWVDKGYVVCSSTDKNWNKYAEGVSADGRLSYGQAYFRFNAIDPTYIVDPKDGKHWLIYGSWHSGFAIMELDPASGKPKAGFKDGQFVGLGEPWNNNPNYGTRIATRHATYRWQGSEGPEVICKDGKYYLFMAYDGLDIPYNTRVVRSSSITGPFIDLKGTNVTDNGGDSYPIVTHPYKFSKGDGWVGISHCCIFQQEGTGDWFYCSQGRLPAGVDGNASSNALMMGHVRRIVWAPATASAPDDLWPITLPERYAGLAKEAVTEAEIAGNWEHIHLYYDQGNMRTSQNWVFKADKTFTGFNKNGGAINGTWAFDAARQFLTITPAGGTSVIVVVAHEADWEANPRVKTVVYAGIDKANDATLWGKKVK